LFECAFSSRVMGLEMSLVTGRVLLVCGLVDSLKSVCLIEIVSELRLELLLFSFNF
jgi:hypothetical protein